MEGVLLVYEAIKLFEHQALILVKQYLLLQLPRRVLQVDLIAEYVLQLRVAYFQVLQNVLAVRCD